ncbi:MAG: UDP-N-acetylmuramoyl-L-alanyl-D-glutamate--2,6-diaminopimelate ligase [Phycisphaerae bacterium]
MMRLGDLLKSVPVPLHQVAGGAMDPIIHRVVEDSRTVRVGDLFVARTGLKNNGRHFIAEAIEHGAAAVVTASSQIVATTAAVPVLQCAQPAVALGFLAQAIHEFPARNMKLLAVTGTNGKTTTTYLLRGILRMVGIPCGLLGTVQLDDGQVVVESPMTTPGPVELAALLARMRDHGVRAVALEASSHALAQDRLAGLNIHVAMFTNLTGDHLDYHGTMENYAATKARLFTALAPDAFAIINAQDAWSSRMIRDCRARTLSYGIDGPADFSGSIHAMSSTGMEVSIRGPDGMLLDLRTGLLGRHNVQNMLCAAAACWAAGVAPEFIIAGLQAADLVPGRLQPVVPAGVKREKLPFTVLVDYAHTHDALENVLTAIRGFTTGKIICLFGCGGDRDITKRPKMAAVVQRLADKIVVTDDNPRTEASAVIITQIVRGFSGDLADRLTVIPDRATAIRYAIAGAEKGDVVLIAGKGHENYQIIGTNRYHFDDVEQAQEAIRARLGLTTNGTP